jgi:predicted transcriptional regulator YdeE
MTTYTQDAFEHRTRHERTVPSARIILSLLLQNIPAVDSAVDVGCGVGTWLSVLKKEKGVKTIQGIDGAWVDESWLEIPEDSFQRADLSQPFKLSQRFDLAISLEVAEHLPPASAKGFVRSLTELSDYVLFSAAIPFQGGKDHINEQWQSYWVELFAAQGYVTYDFIRTEIWNDDQIPFWYRQNILFFARKEQTAEVKAKPLDDGNGALPLLTVHPDLYLAKIYQAKSVQGSLWLFLKAIKDAVQSALKKG